jgi:hypothetical protein
MIVRFFSVSKLESIHRGVFIGHWEHREEKDEMGLQVPTIGRLLRTLRDTK